MDRFLNIVVAAGLGCFALAFVLSALYPFLLNEASVPETTLDELAQHVSPDFRDSQERWPEGFRQAYGAEQALTMKQLVGVDEIDPLRAASEAAWRAAYRQALQDGRDTYVAEGCWHCHSQYVRPVAHEDQRFGPVSRWEQDNNALQRPVMWGTRRVGPDLTYEGGLRSNDWHAAHFWGPTDVTPGSVMPRYRWFFREGYQLRRRIDPELAERMGLDPDTSYPLAGVYDTSQEAQAALVRERAQLPSNLADESERLYVAEGLGLNGTGLSLLAYVQWLGTWQPPSREELDATGDES
jgi:cytochrome c oxidase cbb3-type subunit 2